MSTKIRAKFRCTMVSRNEGKQELVSLTPAASDANTDWSKYTPMGKIDMTITAEGAVGKFEPGKEYFVDFTPAE